MVSIALKVYPCSFMAICVPSPQSIKRELPLNRVSREVSHLPGSGIIPPVPNKHTSNIKAPFRRLFHLTESKNKKRHFLCMGKEKQKDWPTAESVTL
jgi:hypothetical protein